MTEYMSELDYKTSEDTRDDVLIQCAQEISMISRGKELIGEFIGGFEIYDGYFIAQFEDRSNCEVTTDSIRVPCQYVYNKEYREFYRKYLIQDSVPPGYVGSNPAPGITVYNEVMTMDKTEICREPEYIAAAKESNRLRELQFRSDDLGVAIDDDTNSDTIAAKLSALIDEEKDDDG